MGPYAALGLLDLRLAELQDFQCSAEEGAVPALAEFGYMLCLLCGVAGLASCPFSQYSVNVLLRRGYEYFVCVLSSTQ